MNFYSVKVGKMTRRGVLNESISFVCETDGNLSEVYSHLRTQYNGFDVDVSQIVDVKKAIINSGSNKEESLLRKQVKELNEKLKEDEVTHFKGSIDFKQYDSDIQEKVVAIKGLNIQLYRIKKEVREMLNSQLKRDNSKYAHWARADKGLSDDFSSYSYEIYLKGSLIKNIRDAD